ncbi:MAG: T9SS type A sorting domain-containing protein [Bacteroidales bacterium]|nr:T9SS type A sorting domain-containing protein [Bacteroidales bacterium]
MEKERIILTLITLIIIGQSIFAQSVLPRIYEYDEAGNRVLRKVLVFKSAETDTSDVLVYDNENLSLLSAPKCEMYDEQIEDVSVLVFPNPTIGIVTMRFNKAVTKGSFQLFSLSGQMLMDGSVKDWGTIIDLSSLPSGTYLLKFNIESRTDTWKIIKR